MYSLCLLYESQDVARVILLHKFIYIKKKLAFITNSTQL